MNKTFHKKSRVMNRLLLTALLFIAAQAHGAYVYDVSWETDLSAGSGFVSFPELSGAADSGGLGGDFLFDIHWTFLGEGIALSNATASAYEVAWEIVDSVLTLTALDLEFTTFLGVSDQYWRVRGGYSPEFSVMCEDLLDHTNCGGVSRVGHTVPIQFTPRTTSVPEPSTGLVLGLGLACLVGLRVRR